MSTQELKDLFESKLGCPSEFDLTWDKKINYYADNTTGMLFAGFKIAMS